MSVQELTERLKLEAARLGFDRVGIAPAVTPLGYPHFLRWLEEGRAAGMGYLEAHEPARSHPSSILDGVRSVVMVSVVYGTGDRHRRAAEPEPTVGKVAQYAQRADYHRVLWDKLGALLEWLRGERPDARGRAVVDTAPLLERDYARLAGLGWIGKNTMLIDRRLGSFTFLGAMLTDVELAYDVPHAANHCGSCTRCLDACPTDAFVGPYQLDSRKCISYWTIEHRGAIPAPEADQLHGWVFGCDVCQDVCPWNRKAPPGRMAELDPRPEWADPDLVEWLLDGPDEWRARLRGSAASRAKRSGLLRNAALVLGSRRVLDAVDVLAARLDDLREEPVVRASSAWALGQIGTENARDALSRHRDDPHDAVRTAVHRACPADEPRDPGTARAPTDAGGTG